MTRNSIWRPKSKLTKELAHESVKILMVSHISFLDNFGKLNTVFTLFLIPWCCWVQISKKCCFREVHQMYGKLSNCRWQLGWVGGFRKFSRNSIFKPVRTVKVFHKIYVSSNHMYCIIEFPMCSLLYCSFPCFTVHQGTSPNVWKSF